MVDGCYHVPVLLKESVDGLNIGKGGVFVDVTFGGGGHSREILSRLDGGHLYSFDQDAEAEQNIVGSEAFTFVRSNFRFLKNFMRYYGVEQIDGLLADLGVSSHHFDDSNRGFSFRFDGELDMRMNQRAGKTAADVLNSYGEKELADVFCGERMDQYRQHERFEKCSKCELLRFCRGCPAVAYGYTKNFYAADPQCWKE